MSGRVRLCRALTLVWNELKGVVVEYWPTLLVVLLGAYTAWKIAQVMEM